VGEVFALGRQDLLPAVIVGLTRALLGVSRLLRGARAAAADFVTGYVTMV
jgi:hypothetical protein